MNYLACKPWDSGGVLWLENDPEFVFSPGIQHPNIVLVSTNIIEREAVSEPRGVLTRVSRVNHGWAVTLRTAMAQHQLGLKAPAQSCFFISTVRTPGEGSTQLRCIQGICPGLADVVRDTMDICTPLERQLEAGQKTLGHLKSSRHLHLGIWVALPGSASVKVSLLDVFWENLKVRWVRPLWCVDVVCVLRY